MPKLSTIIPHMPLPGTEEALSACLSTLQGQQDELILVINDGIGFGAAVNRGLRWASGDFIVVANNDTMLVKGNLKFLAVKGAVTVPHIIGQPDQMPRSFYCMSRDVLEEVGGYDERFKIGYFEDDDMIQRWKLAGVSILKMDDVVVVHQNGGGLTIKQLGESENFEANKIRFEEKWG